jgi:hypothetical protein
VHHHREHVGPVHLDAVRELESALARVTIGRDGVGAGPLVGQALVRLLPLLILLGVLPRSLLSPRLAPRVGTPPLVLVNRVRNGARS